MKIQRINTVDGSLDALLAELRTRLSPSGNVVTEKGRQRTIEVFGKPLTPTEVVQRICFDVQSNGIDALLDYTQKLDNVDVTADTIRVAASELESAHRQADPQFLGTIRKIRDNIHEFQSAILHNDVTVTRDVGVTLRQRYLPLQRAGICVPGGAAAYPSTVLMTAVPAQAAGVAELAVIAPPTKFGANNLDVLATCHELGIREVYRVGGAQGVAALAYGVSGLPSVDKIVGPGNLFVALAKQHVFGHVDIDAIAGPSEVVVLADETTRPDFAAADMLAQAEHAPGASILITWHAETLTKTLREIERQVEGLSRHDETVQSLEDFAAVILARDADEACEITNQIAPEHLHIAVDNAARLVEKTRFAGAIFLGHHTPVALGDYAAGPSHVLPTSGTARWASGLSSNDFLRTNSVIEYSEAALREIAPTVQGMAEKEGLTAHRQSVDIRRQQ